MDLSFYKLRVADSDLILVDDLSGGDQDRDWPAAARTMLDRRLGAGGESLAVLSKAETKVWLRVFDREGGKALCPFDASLCAARYLLDSGRSGSESVELSLPGGGLVVEVIDASSLGLRLGRPRGLPDGEELGPAGLASRKSLIEAGGERYEVLPLALAAVGTEGRAAAPGERVEAVAVFCEGGARTARARIGAARRGGRAPAPMPIRLVSRGELRLEARRGRGLDASAAAGLALAAAAAAGYADNAALVGLPGGALWVEWTDSGRLFAAGRPEYVYRGEFHLDEPAGI